MRKTAVIANVRSKISSEASRSARFERMRRSWPSPARRRSVSTALSASTPGASTIPSEDTPGSSQ
jgi:hypothetical protein